MDNDNAKKGELWKRILQIILFAGVVIIDIVRCDGNGAQWAAGNGCTGFVIGGIILLHYGFQPLKKLWIVLSGIVTIAAIISVKWWFFYIPGLFYGNTMVMIANLWVFSVCIYLIVRDWIMIAKQKDAKGSSLFKQRMKSYIKNPVLWLFAAFMITAWIMKDNTYKPGFNFFIFAILFLVPFTGEEKKKLFSDLTSGIIIGFWIQQIAAFGLRPYTEHYLRYRGMYYNANMFSLFCLVVLVVTMLKMMEVRKAKIIWHILLAIQCFGLLSLIIFSVGRVTCFFAVVSIVVFVVLTMYVYGRMALKKIFLHIGLGFVMFMLVFPFSFLCIKYLPQIVTHQVYFQDEYLYMVDLDNPDNYVTFDQFLEHAGGRLVLMWKDYGKVGEQKEKKEGTSEEVSEETSEPVVADPEYGTRIYYLDYNEGYNAFGLRIGIWRTFLHNLNWTGHTNSVRWLTPYKQINHAHNIFVQMLYSYGILGGVFFALWTIAYCYRACVYMKGHKGTWLGLVPIMIVFPIFGFGCVELDWMFGQMTWFLLLFTQILLIQNKECPTITKEKTN